MSEEIKWEYYDPKGYAEINKAQSKGFMGSNQ